ncbi:ricin-type beta-trefoil lectin domain protein [Kitasatospora sp. NPDC008050]|uniref:ricin-type beta-trefoil lectin domain protein n=1 Tax=Kitasatospora sp. NPDC008050 TaxID=3364021 RepID=UPI0036E59F76
MLRPFQASPVPAGGAFTLRRVRRIAGVLTLSLALEAGVTLSALPLPKATAAPAPAAAPATPANEAPDESSALLSARLQNHRVEVTGERTETVTVWANPNGTLTAERATGPIRMRVGQAWVPVDTTLVERPDGKIAPKAHPEGLVFEAGDATVKAGDPVAAPGTAPSPAAGATRAARALARPLLATDVPPSSGPPTPGATATATATPPASQAPAQAPTETPTQAPTQAPTETPTQAPTQAPAQAPPQAPARPAEGALVQLGDDSHRIELGWLGKLPKPKLDGSTATYVDARPGVDLVLQATRTGFEQFLVIKDRAAVDQAGTIVIPLDTKGLEVDRKGDGSIELIDRSAGKAVGRIPAPVMWDATVDPLSDEHLHRGPVTMELRGQGADAELVFTPDAGFLTDPRTSFPVTVDPVVDLGTSFDTFVQSDTGSDQSTATELKLGTYNGGSVKARSFLHFPGAAFNGKHVLGASLNLWNFHSSYCLPKQWEVWSAQYADSNSRWGNQPGLGKRYAVSDETRDIDTADTHQCANPDGSAWVKADVTQLVREWSGMNAGQYALGIKAADENDSYTWKKFSSAEGNAPPFLSVTYNTVPATPAGVDVLPSQQGNPRYTNSATPTFSVLASDPDGGQVGANIDLWRNGTFVKSVYREGPNGSYLKATPADFGIARLDEGVSYAVFARLWDGTDYSGWSQATTVVADTVKPGAPFVTSAAYPADGLWHGAAGQGGAFSFTPAGDSADLVGFVYTLDGGAAVTVNATAATSVTVTPPTDGHRVLKVQAKDRAGNLSEPTVHAFQVGRAGLSSPVDGSQTAKRVKLSVDAQTDFKRVVYQYRRGPGAAEYNVPLANLAKADNTPVTDGKPRLSELGGFANWTVIDTLGQVGGVVQVRAVLFPEDGSGSGYPTAWNTLTVDRNADGAAGTTIGPGSVNLLTGDFSTDVTDANEAGLSVSRSASSRGTDRGWQPQGERLTANQRQVSTDLGGFTAGQATLSRSTARGHDNSTDSLLVTPAASGWDSYAALGPEYTLAQGMKPGRTYRLTGWIYVPAATGLDTSALPNRGLKLVGVHKSGGVYGEVASAKAGFTDAWQQLSVDLTVPKDATEAWFRLYNGFPGGSNKEVHFDDLSLKELVAPFGPQWAGGPDAGTGSDYRSLSFPQSDLAEIKLNDDSVVTFAKGTDGSFFPEPGAEHLALKANPAGAGRISIAVGGRCLDVNGANNTNGTAIQTWDCNPSGAQQWTRGDNDSLMALGKCLDAPKQDNYTKVWLWDCWGGPNQKWELRPDGSYYNAWSDRCLDSPDNGGQGTQLTIHWCHGGANQRWVPETPGTTYTLSELDGSSTEFTRATGSSIFQVSSETGPEAASSTRYLYDAADGRALVKRVIAPVEPGIDDTNHCSVDPLPRGCDVLDYDYATATTAVPGAPGDFTDRVRSVKVWSWNPDTNKQEAVEVTHYAYDDRGRLAEVWDPRAAAPMKIGYSYDDAGRVTRISSKGELPWDFDFGKAAADQDPGRLLKVRRGTLAPGSKDQVNGEIATKLVYEVPLTRGGGGPYELSGAEVARWAQTDAPTDATAVFGPEDEPGTATASQAKPGADGYRPATVHYLNASGNEVNTATPSITPGGDIDTKEYDRFGHAVRTLEATERAIALGTHPEADRFVAELGLPADSAARARLLDSRTGYSADGLDVTETLGPLYRATLSEAVSGGSTPAQVVAEGEALPQLGSTALLNIQRGDTSWVGNGGWSGGAQIMLVGKKAGDNATFRITVPEEGDYLLSAQLTRAGDYGIVKFAVDGTDLVGSFDGYNSSVTTAPWAAGQPIGLARGDHQLTMTVTGSNPSAAAPYFQAGIDALTLTKTTVNPSLAAGTSVLARDHNSNTYDEGKPDGRAYHLITTATDGARIDGYADDVEQRVTRTGYDTPIGGTSGWTLKTPTSVTTDALGAKLTSTIRYDASSRAQESRKPGSNGADAGTVKSVFYTAGANPDDAACGNRPEWAGSPCATLPGGAVTGADASRMTTTLPVKRVTRYSRFNEPEETTETNAGKSRKTVTSYDGLDRITSTEITSDEGLALPKVTTEYDPATGDALKTTAGGKTLSRTTDLLGRLISYTDADGGTTSTEFDTFGKPVKVTDPTGSTSYTYDRAKEPRGLVTSVNDSLAGEFTAKYGPDGQLTEQTYPGGIVRKDTANAVGEATSRTYTRTSDNKVIWAQTTDISTQGQVAKDTSSTATRSYQYDRLGRLTKAEQRTTASGCITRRYSFDAHSNRLAKSTSPQAADGSCGTADGTSESHGYDSADRLTDPGFAYDAFGRTVRTATGATNTYWANDKVAAQEKGDTKQEWAVDAAHRLTAFTTAKKQADGSWANATSRLNHYGDDSDEVRWTIEDTTQGTLTRNVSGPDADLVATTSRTGDVQLQLTNLQGSVVVTTDTALTKPVVLDFDEFGIPQEGQAQVRYGWLGGKERSAEAQDGDILMGARLYSPVLGRFLQIDPVPGGNASAYDYCTGDPVNCTDLDGNWGMPKWLKKTVQVVAKVAEVASYIPGPIGAAAAAVSSVSYAATGNWGKAAEMAVTAAAGLVGANTAVKAASATVTATRAAARANRVASRARTSFRQAAASCVLPNSFIPGTPVLLADGSYAAIESLQPGDLVTATDPTTGETTAEPVLDVIVGYGAKHLVGISTGDSPGTPLVATAQHPLWVAGRGWTDAAAVQVGDALVTSQGVAREVSAVFDAGFVENQLVYNLSVGDLHTFTVLDDGGEVLVHNSCGRGGKQDRLKALLNDPSQPRHVRGWVKQEMNSIKSKSKNKRGNPRKTVRVPPGYELAHLRGKEAHKGFDYSHSVPNTTVLHKLQHKHDNYGRGRRR